MVKQDACVRGMEWSQNPLHEKNEPHMNTAHVFKTNEKRFFFY